MIGPRSATTCENFLRGGVVVTAGLLGICASVTGNHPGAHAAGRTAGAAAGSGGGEGVRRVDRW